MDAHNTERLYRRHAGRLRQFISRRVPNPADVEDILQDTFLRASRAGLPAEALAEEKYLLTIARNLMIDEARRPRLFAADESAQSALQESVAQQPTPCEHLSLQRDMAQVERAVLSMPKRIQQAFLMKVFHGYSHAEIAAEMGVSVKTVEKQVARGYGICRGLLLEDSRLTAVSTAFEGEST